MQMSLLRVQMIVNSIPGELPESRAGSTPESRAGSTPWHDNISDFDNDYELHLSTFVHQWTNNVPHDNT